MAEPWFGTVALTGVMWTRWDPGTSPWSGAGESAGTGAQKVAESGFPANKGAGEVGAWEAVT